MKLFKHLIIPIAMAATLSGLAHAQTPAFTPGRIAVLQLGDGGPGRCAPLGAIIGITNYNASDIIGARQTQLFIDEFDPTLANQTTNYSVQVAIPTNGPGAMLINGNAGTEGGMTLSADKSVLTFSGYQGDILSITTGGQTAPSNLSYDRGIGTVDAFTNYANPYRGGGWYGIATGKTNPRGVATDGAGNFWGCGNGYGSLYFTASLGQPIQFQNIALTSFSKICNNSLYASVKKSEAVNLYPAGIYSFVDFFNNPVAYPTAAAYLHLEIPAEPAFSTIIGFDINPKNDIAYVADTAAGIQKYIKSGLSWKIAYNLSIPGYLSQNSGLMSNGVIANVSATNNLVGAFSLTVDWSGPNPVIYATTSDTTVTNSPYYGNRVIRINDTNTVVIGTNSILATTNILTTVVHPPVVAGLMLTNVVYKSVTFTPDLRPVIATNPVSLSVVVGDNVSFSVLASSASTLNYQWQKNGTNLPSQNNAGLNLNNVQLAANNTTYQCVVTNNYGAITSAVATLQVSSLPTLPAWSKSNITNYIGNTVSVPINFTNGTDPKGGYQWFHDGTPLTDGGEYSGTGTSALLITQIAAVDSGAYTVIVTNTAGSVTGLVANFTALYAPPIFVQPPVSGITFFGHNFTNAVSAYGVQLNYQWYKSSKTTLSGSTLTTLTDANEFSGSATASLGVTGATNSSATNYVVVVSNPGGSITSAPVVLTVQLAPPHTFAAYNNPGQVYLQNFNSLPIPGLGSAEGANPLHVPFVMTNVAAMITNGNPGVLTTISADLNYSVDNPVDFGYPIITNGAIGGWGLSNSMAGWYGWCQKTMVIAAGRGDQSQGAIIDNGGNYYADGAPLSGITNRALGLVATTKTGPNAMGVALVNRTSKTLNSVNLSYTGELWRNNPNQQPLKFGYVITDTNSLFQPDLWDATNGIAYVPSLDVVFPTSPTTTVNVGTQSSNQVNLAVSGMTVSNWAPGAVLWLTWQAQTLGSAQDVAIDNVRFSANQTYPAAVIIVGSNSYASYSPGLTNGQWVYVDSDPAAGSPVRATQRSLGYREVDYKKQVPPTLFFSAVTPTTNSGVLVYDYSAQSASTNLVGFWVAKDVPIIIGTDGLAYITDGHHTTAGYLAATSLFRQIVPGQDRIILGHIVANYYSTNTGLVDVNDAWWLARAAENNAFLYGTNGDLLTLSGEPNYANLQPILPSVLAMPTTPSTLTTNGVTAMVSSKYRGLTWGMADAIVVSGTTSAGVKIAGYKKAAPGSSVDLNFVEFYWSDFLRNRIVWDDSLSGSPFGSPNGDASVTAAPLSFFTAVANGIALARSEVYHDEYGRMISAYTNSLLFPPTTVNWARGSISNGFANATDTYQLYIRNDSTIAGDITPSASGSTNILHIDAATALTVTNVLANFRTVIVNGGATLNTKWKDATVTNSILTLPPGTAAVTFNGTMTTGSLVVSNGSFGGNGVINGSVTVSSGATLAPGSSVGILTVNGALALNGITVMELSKSGLARTNDAVVGITSLSLGGTLNVTASGTALAGGDTFRLLNATSYAGSFAATNLPTLASGLAWDTHNLGVNGSIAVVSTTSVSLATTVSGGNLNLAWPSDHTGWRLEVQTNSLATGIKTNWFTWPNSAESNAAVIPVNSTNPAVFLRLVFP